jgi:hypothetical protein
MGCTQFENRSYESAEKIFTDVLRTREKILPLDNPYVLVVMKALSQTYKKLFRHGLSNDYEVRIGAGGMIKLRNLWNPAVEVSPGIKLSPRPCPEKD